MPIDGKYQQRVTRATPGCLIFLLDHSYSMVDGLAGSPRPKCEALATAINRFISELIIKCERGDDLFPYFDVGVIGYTTDKAGAPIIGPALQGALAGHDLVSIPDLNDNPLVVETRQKDDGVGGIVEVKFPVWYKAPSEDDMAGTPMIGALEYAYRVASEWCASHPECLPPLVIHLTDGEASDGEPPAVEAAAMSLRSLETDDGNVLLFNCHLSANDTPGIMFPTSEDELPDEYARLLFRMSSPLPEKLRQMAETQGILAPTGARGMVFNADGVKMIALINIGTLVVPAPAVEAGAPPSWAPPEPRLR
jgi:hypothetical protein